MQKELIAHVSIPKPPLQEKVQYGFTDEEKRLLRAGRWVLNQNIVEKPYHPIPGFLCGQCPYLADLPLQTTYQTSFSDPILFPTFSVSDRFFAFHPDLLEFLKIGQVEYRILKDDFASNTSEEALALNRKLGAVADTHKVRMQPVDSPYFSTRLQLSSTLDVQNELASIQSWFSVHSEKKEYSIIFENVFSPISPSSFAQILHAVQVMFQNLTLTIGLRLHINQLSFDWVSLLYRENINLTIVIDSRTAFLTLPTGEYAFKLEEEIRRCVRRILDEYTGMVTAQITGPILKLTNLLQFLVDVGFRSIDFLYPWGLYISSQSQITEQCNDLQQCISFVKTMILNGKPIDLAFLTNTWKKIFLKDVHQKYCEAGQDHWLFGVGDQMVVCDGFRTFSVPDGFNSWPGMGCKVCWARNLCKGFCPSALAHRHVIPDCDVKRSFYYTAVETFLSLFLSAPNLLRNYCYNSAGIFRENTFSTSPDISFIYHGG